MKISNIRIKGFQQFKDTYLDFTNPETGKPVSKICLIGRNGTGKSTLLNFIDVFLPQLNTLQYRSLPFLLIKFNLKERDVYFFSSSYLPHNILISSKIESEKNWLENLTEFYNTNSLQQFFNKMPSFVIQGNELKIIQNELLFKNNSSDLIIHSPAESQLNSYMQVGDVPQTNVNAAQTLFNQFPFQHSVSDQNVKEFWSVLIYLIKKRESDRNIFENKEENLKKIKKDLIEEFDKINPKILEKLAELWNKILGKAGLEFDVKNANNPIQLNDNLRAYIHLKQTKQRINYNQLSTGIRNFIFRVGHIYSLYFNREIKRGFLFLDEPENSLFPDFLFDLVETYQELLNDKNGENNTQFFVSTHNPIIAAQFQPYERIILEWNDDGFVDAHKGNAGIGDDPNDVLIKDFNLKNLMGKKGQEMWEEYLELKKKLRRTEDNQEKEKLISKIRKIGSDYNFEN